MCNNQQNSTIEETPHNLPYKHCLNCGTELNGMYCHVCGQQATSKTPTITGFVMEYLNNAFIWDPKFFQTLWTLVRRPGHLTNEFLSGKFTSQEHPLKLNMFLLFVFITLFFFFSGTEKMNDSVHILTDDERLFAGLQLEFLKDNQEYIGKIKESPLDTVLLQAPLFLAEKHPEILTNLETIENTHGEALDKWTAIVPHVLIEEKIIQPTDNGYYHFSPEAELGKEDYEIIRSVWTEMVDFITQYFPMIVLFTAPLLSMSLGFVQRKSKLPRIHHFIFSLHYTAFLEFLMMCIYLLHLTIAPSIEVLEWIMIIGSCGYLTIAFHQVYGTNTWFKALIKALFTSLVYFIISLIIFIGIFLIACFMVADML